jgi:hypothetical protein
MEGGISFWCQLQVQCKMTFQSSNGHYHATCVVGGQDHFQSFEKMQGKTNGVN